MAEKANENELVTVEELALSNSFEITAIFNILERKGLITKSELMDELKRLKTEH